MSHILIIDADKRYRHICMNYFESRGYNASEAASAQTAIAICEADKPEVIILDLQLVGHSGVEFLHELRSYSEWQQVPVIILSSVQEAAVLGFKSAWRSLGVVKYLYKPETSLKKLNVQIAEVLALHV